MSIVVTVVLKNESFAMGADKRGSNAVFGISDTYKKLHQVSTSVYCGITGTLEPGLDLIGKLAAKQPVSVDEIIRTMDTLFIPTQQKLTMTIAGREDEGGFFIWSKNNEGRTEQTSVDGGKLSYAIQTTNANSKEIITKFMQLTRQVRTLKQLIAETISYAASIDPSVSQAFDYVQIDR